MLFHNPHCFLDYVLVICSGKSLIGSDYKIPVRTGQLMLPRYRIEILIFNILRYSENTLDFLL